MSTISNQRNSLFSPNKISAILLLAMITSACTIVGRDPNSIHPSQSLNATTESPINAQAAETPNHTLATKTPILTQAASPEPTAFPLLDQYKVESVTLDGITGTLAWAYADEARIGIEYRITNFNLPTGYQIYCPVSSDTLIDDKGKDYGKYLWGGLGGDDPWNGKIAYDATRKVRILSSLKTISIQQPAICKHSASPRM